MLSKRHYLNLVAKFVLAILIMMLPVASTSSVSAQENKTPWAQIVSNSNSPKALKILFIGHSKFYINDLPRLFTFVSKMQNPTKPLKVGSVFGSSYTLQEHWESGLAKKMIHEKGPWDYIIVIERTGYPVEKRKQTEIYFNLFNQEARAAKAQLILTESYPDKSDEYEELHEAMAQYSRKFRCPLLPIGCAWNMILKRNPRLNLFAPDKHHPSFQGTYLMASVCYTFFENRKLNLKPVKFQINNQKKTISNLNLNALHEAAWQANIISKGEETYLTSYDEPD